MFIWIRDLPLDTPLDSIVFCGLWLFLLTLRVAAIENFAFGRTATQRRPLTAEK